jgi:ABC-2 type transport system permease protein
MKLAMRERAGRATEMLRSPSQRLGTAVLASIVRCRNLAVAFGLVAKTPEGANSLSLIMLVLPFVSSAFVPTRSMPEGVRGFAQNQSFTPVINTLGGLFTGTPIGNNAILAVGWCLGLTALGYLSARSRYDCNPVR